jgi:hypothetical protein
MSRRITVVLDDEVAEGLALLEGRSASARVNAALRLAIERERRRAAALAWVHAMNEDLGAPTDDDYAKADQLLDELGIPRPGVSDAA